MFNVGQHVNSGWVGFNSDDGEKVIFLRPRLSLRDHLDACADDDGDDDVLPAVFLLWCKSVLPSPTRLLPFKTKHLRTEIKYEYCTVGQIVTKVTNCTITDIPDLQNQFFLEHCLQIRA